VDLRRRKGSLETKFNVFHERDPSITENLQCKEKSLRDALEQWEQYLVGVVHDMLLPDPIKLRHPAPKRI